MVVPSPLVMYLVFEVTWIRTHLRLCRRGTWTEGIGGLGGAKTRSASTVLSDGCDWSSVTEAGRSFCSVASRTRSWWIHRIKGQKNLLKLNKFIIIAVNNYSSQCIMGIIYLYHNNLLCKLRIAPS